MPTRKLRFNSNQVEDFRLADAKRCNNPPAGIAPIYATRECQTVQHAYEPHLIPQLQWAGKAEHTSFEVDVISRHIHERISTRAILNAVTRPITSAIGLLRRNATTGRPADRVLPARSGWVNRLILGDSLLVMKSLFEKDGMADEVRIICQESPD